MEKIKINIDLVNDNKIFDEMYEKYLSCPAAVKYARSLGITDEIAKEKVNSNDVCVDMTIGNGNDTVFLCQILFF